MNRKLCALLTLTLAIIWCVPSFGQVIKGSISGTVVDPAGAVVSGAQIKATHSETGVVLNTKSDGSGLFRFNLVPVGNYRVEISGPGFKTAVQNQVSVVAGSDVGMGSVKLAVGEATTTLEITADAPLIESTQSQITSTFSGTQLATFAGVQENQGMDNLALFVPGIVSVRDQGFSNTNGGVGFSSNGIRGRNNDQEIDGQNNNDNSVAGASLSLSDAEFLQQYIVISNNFGPEYGRNAGSVVNLITKSGTNAWHGSIYGNENNSILNTLTTTQKLGVTPGLTKPPRSNDEFTGFTIGGPIVKNKLFFFGGFDNEILSLGTLYSTGLVTPTPAGLATLAGCFPTGASANAVAALSKFGPFGISAGNPVASPTGPGNTFLAPTVAGCPGVQIGTVSRLLPTPSHIFNWVARTDWQLGNDTVSARYIFARNNSFNTQDNGAAGYVVNVPALSQAVLISETHNFSPRMVNEARIGFDRLNVQFGGNTIGTEPTTANLTQALTNVSFSDGATLGYGPNPVLPQGRVVNTWQVQDNWNYSLGRHSLKAGVNYTRQQSPNIFLPNINGNYSFPSLDAYILNAPSSVNIGAGNPELGLKENDTFLYFGDDWKIRPNLTVNLGLTWSYFGQPINLLNQIDTKNETGPNPLFDPNLPLSVRVAPKIGAYGSAFGPNVGFAYSPQWGGFLTGRGKTVIRGGYRLSYDPAYYNIYLNNATGSPNILAATLTGSDPRLQLPANPTGPNVRALLFGGAAPVVPVGKLDPRSLGETAVPNNFRPDQVQGYSFGIEREITKNSAFEIRYVGNHATNLFQSVNTNPFVGIGSLPGLAQVFPSLVPAGVTGCTTPGVVLTSDQIAAGIQNPALGRANCAQGGILSRNNSAFSDYNGLQLQFRAQNLFHQLTVQTGYTWSKTTDNASEIFSTGAGGNTVSLSQNPFNSAGSEHSLSGLDFPHQWTINFNEALPFFKEQHGLVGHVLGGWSLAGNYILASGQTYTPIMVFATNLTDGALVPGLGTQSIVGAGVAGDFFDQNFLNQFLGIGVARPFAGNPKAPVNTVGMFAGDVCFLGQVGVFAPGPTTTACAAPTGQLLLLNDLNNSKNPKATSITAKDVRFIANTAVAQQLFGTPFGNVGRNSLRDAISNIANFSVYKSVKIGERASFTFHTTFDNVFNHPNFATVSPFVENAGNTNFGNSFANPRLTGDSIPGSNIAASRRIYFGGVFRF